LYSLRIDTSHSSTAPSNAYSCGLCKSSFHFNFTTNVTKQTGFLMAIFIFDEHIVHLNTVLIALA